MKKRFMCCLLSIMFVISFSSFNIIQAKETDATKYIGRYFIPQSSSMCHFGDELQIFEITDTYIDFEYQNPHSGHANIFTAERAYFDNNNSATCSGTVAFADTPYMTSPISYRITLCSQNINLQIYNGDTLWQDLTFNLYNQNIFYESKQDKDNYNYFYCAVGDKYIDVLNKKLTVTDIVTRDNFEVSSNASWNFITDGKYLYYLEYSGNFNSLHRLNLENYDDDTLYSADGLSITDCIDNKYVLIGYNPQNTDDPTENSLAVYDIEKGMTYNIANWVFGIGFCGNRVVYIDQTQQYSPVNLYSSDIYGNNKSKISELALYGDIYVDNDYIYYAEALKNSVITPPFIVKKCNAVENNITALTDTINDKYIYNITSEYVEYHTYANGNENERTYFSETNNDEEIKVILNGTELSFDQPPIMDPAGRILVPIRGIAEAIGDTVKWNDDIKTALIRHRDRALIIPLNENQLYIAVSDMPYEWQTYDLDVPSQVQNGRTLTPVRAFCESLGATVEWNGDEQTAYITYKDNGISNDITDYDISGINMAYAIMRNYNVSFEDYTDEIYDFLESRNSTLDLVAMSWGGGVFDGFARLMSGNDATETAIKESLAKVIAELPDTETGASAFKDFEEGVLGVKEIIGQSDAFDDLPKENWDIKNIDDFNKLKDIAPNADCLKKAEKATGIAIDAVGFTIEQLVYWIADYEKNLEKLDELEAYFRAAAINDDMIYEAIDDLKDEYSQKWLRTLSDFRDDVVDKGLSKAVDLATGGAFSIVNFAKDMTNNVTGLSTTADGLNRFYALCCYNGAFDLTYQKKMNDVNKWRFHGNEASDLFEWQRAVKKTIFKSMNDIANGVKEVSWDNRITELDNMTYIIWQ